MSSLKAKLAAMSSKLTARCGGEEKRSGEKHGAAPPRRPNAKKRKRGDADPSARYLAQPLSAPIVGRWRSYFGAGREVRVGPKRGWRSVAKLAARRVGGRVLLGLFAPGTHEIRASARDAAAHSDALNVAVAAVERACGDVAVYATGDAAGNGALTYVGFAEETATRTVSVSLVFNAAPGGADAAAEAVARRVAGAPWLHSLHAHCNSVSPHDNAIYGRGGPETWRQMHPKPATRASGFAYDAAGCTTEAPLSAAVPLHFAPQCFRQANLRQFFEIVKAAKRFVRPGDAVVEFYGGVASIGAHLLDVAASVACSDENPWNDGCVALLKARLPPALAAKLTYEPRAAGDLARAGRLADCDVVLVDPPRKGLCADVRAALDRPGRRPRRLVYVSCGFDALQRDLTALETRWATVHVEGHVLFPGADHIETLVVLDERPG